MPPVDLLLQPALQTLAAAAGAAADGNADIAASAYADPGQFAFTLYAAVVVGLVSIPVGMALCLYRLWKGPQLADRVIAADVFAFHVVALVIVLSVYLSDLTFFDAVLGVAIVGFASTVGFAQYIGARGGVSAPEDAEARTRTRAEDPR